MSSMENYKKVFGERFNAEAILEEAMALSGGAPSTELIVGLTVKQIAIEFDELEERVKVLEQKVRESELGFQR